LNDETAGHGAFLETILEGVRHTPVPKEASPAQDVPLPEPATPPPTPVRSKPAPRTAPATPPPAPATPVPKEPSAPRRITPNLAVLPQPSSVPPPPPVPKTTIPKPDVEPEEILELVHEKGTGYELIIPQIVNLPKLGRGLKYDMCLQALEEIIKPAGESPEANNEIELELAALARSQKHRWRDFKEDMYDTFDIPYDARKKIDRALRPAAGRGSFNNWASVVFKAYLQEIGYFPDEKPEYDNGERKLLKRLVVGTSAALSVGVLILGGLLLERQYCSATQQDSTAATPAAVPAQQEPEPKEPEPVQPAAAQPTPAEPAPEPAAPRAPSDSYTPVGRVVRAYQPEDGGCLVMVRRPDGSYTEAVFTETDPCAIAQNGMLAYTNTDETVGFCNAADDGRCDEVQR